MSAEAPILGIDLGTTMSIAAIVGPEGPRVLEGEGSGLLPSVAAFLAGGEVCVGEAAQALAFDEPGRVIHSVKRLIGRSLAELRIEADRLPYEIVEGPQGSARVRVPLDGKDGRPPHRDLSPEEVSAEILREVHARALRDLAREGLVFDEPPRRVVVTVPAYFDEAQRQATQQAATLAGLEVVRLVNEPTAASLAYGIDGSKDGLVCVYDLGGGTFDVSVLRVSKGVFRVLATRGDTRLGGDDFDALLASRILARIRDATGGELDADARLVATLRRSAQGLKHRLSQASSARLEIDVGEGASVTLDVERDDFEADIAPLVERSLHSLHAALADAGVATEEIDHLVLVGGSTRVPLVRRRLAETFGREARDEVDPDRAVALGAALQAEVLAGGSRELLLLDVVPLSLGIETLGGTFAKLVLRNSTVPCATTEEFSTQADNQTGVDLNVFQGERELVRDCRPIGSLRLTGIPPMPAGLPRVAVTFTVDAQGLLRVSARELRSGKTASVEMQPTLNLSRDEVHRMVGDSIAHAGEDFAAREALELRQKARAVLRGTELALERGGAGIDPSTVYAIRKAAGRVRALVEEGEIDALHEALDRLSALTAQVADLLIGAAVTSSLDAREEGERT